MIRPSSVALVFLLSGRALAQAGYEQDALPPERPMVPPLNPQGRSPNQRPWAQHAYWIWIDGQGWHLRATTAGHSYRFSGGVEAADGLQDVHALDPNLPLQVTGRSIQFDVVVSGGEQGFDWRPLGSGCTRFNVAIDGFPRPGNVKIGAGEGRPPGREPFDLCPGGAPPPMAEESVEAAQGPEMEPEAFRPVLAPYGQWIWVPGYGQVWQPYASVVGPNFVPYTNGSWAYSDAGWVFASSYQWGWAPFHYGNWVNSGVGWCWVPGRVWGPAWVDWRYGSGYVGWYPLAPVGYTGVVVVQQPVYTYVPVNHFTSQNVGAHVVSPAEVGAIHAQTHPVVSAGYVGGHAVAPVNAGPPVTAVSAAVGHPIAAVPVHQVSSAAPVLPPASQPGVHYVSGASAAHPVVTAPMQVSHPAATLGGAHPTVGGTIGQPGAGGAHPTVGGAVNQPGSSGAHPVTVPPGWTGPGHSGGGRPTAPVPGDIEPGKPGVGAANPVDVHTGAPGSGNTRPVAPVPPGHTRPTAPGTPQQVHPTNPGQGKPASSHSVQPAAVPTTTTTPPPPPAAHPAPKKSSGGGEHGEHKVK